MILRELGIFETAMLIAYQHAPFNIISVLRMEAAPSPDGVKAALSLLQERHPLLRARIIEKNNHPYFDSVSSTTVPFTVIERTSPDQWRQVAEKELTFGHNAAIGPLFRAVYLFQGGCGDLVLNVHHAIVDAVSGINILDEMLRFCTGDVADLPPLELAPALDQRFPPPYQGLQKAFPKMGYVLSQMIDMLSYQWKNRGKRIPIVHLGGEDHTATLILSEELVTALAWRGRKEGLTLNSLLNAALVLGTNRHLYAGKPVTMRTFTFVDLRPFTQPRTPPEDLVNYISMLGQTVDVSGEQDYWGLAKILHAKIYRSLKSGDKFSASLMSEMLLNMITRYKFMRFGSTALSYSGVASLRQQYGNIKVVGLHGFVSGFDLGPEVASQARLFNDQVWWDFIFLDTDMDAEMAGKIISEIKIILEKAGRGLV